MAQAPRPRHDRRAGESDPACRAPRRAASGRRPTRDRTRSSSSPTGHRHIGRRQHAHRPHRHLRPAGSERVDAPCQRADHPPHPPGRASQGVAGEPDLGDHLLDQPVGRRRRGDRSHGLLEVLVGQVQPVLGGRGQLQRGRHRTRLVAFLLASRSRLRRARRGHGRGRTLAGRRLSGVVGGAGRRRPGSYEQHSPGAHHDGGHEQDAEACRGHQLAAWKSRFTAVGAIPARIAPTAPPSARALPRDACW